MKPSCILTVAVVIQTTHRIKWHRAYTESWKSNLNIQMYLVFGASIVYMPDFSNLPVKN